MEPALLLLLALAASPASDAGVRQYRGDAAGALRAAESALASSPGDAATSLAATCAAIELGDLQRAGTLLTPLERRRSAPPRAAVLRRLIERRHRSSSGALMVDLALAWRDAGRPNLADADPEVSRASQEPLPAVPTSATLTPGEHLLLATPTAPADQRRLALAAAAEADRNALVANVEVLGLLGMQPCPSDLAEQRAGAARALEAALRADAENGYLPVAAWIAGCPTRLDASAVALLANAAARSKFKLPRERAFREILAMTERADAPNARARAISAWLALDVPFIRLAALAEAVEDPSLRRAAGRAIAAIGWRLVEGDAWLERLQGVTLLQKGARLAGEEDAIARAGARVEAEYAVYREWAEAKWALGRWPFAAEWREWSPDEVGASRRLLRVLSEYAR